MSKLSICLGCGFTGLGFTGTGSGSSKSLRHLGERFGSPGCLNELLRSRLYNVCSKLEVFGEVQGLSSAFFFQGLRLHAGSKVRTLQ